MEQVITPEEFKYTDYIRLYEKYEELRNSEEDKTNKILLLLNKITALRSGKTVLSLHNEISALKRALKEAENKSFWDYIKFRKKNQYCDYGENSSVLS